MLPFFLNIFFRNKVDKEKALAKFQKFIDDRKHYTKMAADSSDEFSKQRAEANRKMAAAKKEMVKKK